MMGTEDGVLVFLDHRAPRDTVFDTPESLVHGDGTRVQKEPIASFFMTVEDTNRLGDGLAACGKAQVTVNLFGGGAAAGGAYLHAIVSGEKKKVVGNEFDGETYEITVEFIPKCQKEVEEGEIVAERVGRSYALGIGMHTSHIIETHCDDDKLYIHGMRKVIGHIGWAACGPPVSNERIPMIPPGMTVPECIDVIKGMGLEVGKPEEQEDKIGDDNEEQLLEFRKAKKNAAQWRGPGTEMGKDRRSAACTGGVLPAMRNPPPPGGGGANAAAAFVDSAAEASEEKKKMDPEEDELRRVFRGGPLWAEVMHYSKHDVLVGMMDIALAPVFPVGEWKSQMTNAGEEMPPIHYNLERGLTSEGRKISVYPVGMVTSSRIARIDSGVKVGQFLRGIMPSHFGRENGSRVLLGAFNAFRKDRRIDQQFPRHPSIGKRTFFLEDVECDEMHNYANYVASLLEKSLGGGTTTTTPSPGPTKVAWGAAAADTTRKRMHMEASTTPAAPPPREPQIQSMHGIDWGGGDTKISLHAVRMDKGGGGGGGGDCAAANAAVYAFAFCKTGSSRPFALTGMRHIVYKHMIDMKNEFGDVARGFLEGTSGGGISGISGTVHQYPMSRNSMLEVCCVSPKQNIKPYLSLLLTCVFPDTTTGSQEGDEPSHVVTQPQGEVGDFLFSV